MANIKRKSFILRKQIESLMIANLHLKYKSLELTKLRLLMFIEQLNKLFSNLSWAQILNCTDLLTLSILPLPTFSKEEKENQSWIYTDLLTPTTIPAPTISKEDTTILNCSDQLTLSTVPVHKISKKEKTILIWTSCWLLQCILCAQSLKKESFYAS